MYYEKKTIGDPLQLNYTTNAMKVLWPMYEGCVLVQDDSLTVELLRTGEYDHSRDVYSKVTVRVNGVEKSGCVLIDDNPKTERCRFDDCILHVVSRRMPNLHKEDGSWLTQLVLDPGEKYLNIYKSLADSSGYNICASHIKEMDEVHRTGFFTRLLIERLDRKCGEVREIFESCNDDWNETMFVMLFHAMGKTNNGDAYRSLARKLSYYYIAKERNVLSNVEALLLGTAGLLEYFEDEGYMYTLKQNFRHLQKKYDIIPMRTLSWDISHSNRYNHPVIRLAQLAAFLSTREFMFDNIINCRKSADFHVLFRAEASRFWTSLISNSRSETEPQYISGSTANILGINMVVPLMFTYGDVNGDENIKNAALELLEKINPESYYILNKWKAKGVVMESGFDTQAILQLNNEYCKKKDCWKCHIGRVVMRDFFKGEEIERSAGKAG